MITSVPYVWAKNESKQWFDVIWFSFSFFIASWYSAIVGRVSWWQRSRSRLALILQEKKIWMTESSSATLAFTSKVAVHSVLCCIAKSVVTVLHNPPHLSTALRFQCYYNAVLLCNCNFSNPLCVERTLSQFTCQDWILELPFSSTAVEVAACRDVCGGV